MPYPIADWVDVARSRRVENETSELMQYCDDIFKLLKCKSLEPPFFPLATMSIPTIELYVKLQGSPTAVPVYPNPSDTVYKVIKAIKIELPRLANVDNDLITLHSDPATDPYLPGELIGQLIANLQPPNSGRDPLFVRVHSPVAVPAAATVQSVEHLEHLRHLKAFWIAASQSSTPVEKGRVMGLPDGTYMLGDTTRGIGIFVRNCYPDLFVKTLQLLDEGTPVLLIGNPGIGKTFFGHLLLFELAKRKATVVYVDGSVEREERSYLFKWDESLGEYIVELGQRGNRSQHSSECDKVTTYYICDACTPAPTQARTLMITSPKRSRYHPFTKRHNDGGTVMLYMPIWDLTEIQKCREEIYCELKEAHVGSLFHKWGGIPRWVLHHANNESQQGYLEEVLQQANLESVIASCQAGSANDDTVSHFIIHLMANDNFERLPVAFASDYVETRIFTREFETNQSKLRRFVAVSENEDAFGNIRGNFFEQLAHRDIANGKSFRIRRLKKGLSTAIETITFGARPQFFFENTHHVSNQTTDVYFRPRNKRHEAVDSFQRPNNMYQMCHRKDLRHPVTQKGVHEALKYLGNPINPRLYFVVPATKFDSFSEQGYLGTSGKVLKSVDPVIQAVEQYALEIPNE